jgi:hypothetical protein
VGRPPRSTIAERSEVFRLADVGLSQRTIAERVFGDPRFQLRVLRLLRRRRTWEDADAETRRRCDEQLEDLAALDHDTALAALEEFVGEGADHLVD